MFRRLGRFLDTWLGFWLSRPIKHCNAAFKTSRTPTRETVHMSIKTTIRIPIGTDGQFLPEAFVQFAGIRIGGQCLKSSILSCKYHAHLNGVQHMLRLTAIVGLECENLNTETSQVHTYGSLTKVVEWRIGEFYFIAIANCTTLATYKRQCFLSPPKWVSGTGWGEKEASPSAKR